MVSVTKVVDYFPLSEAHHTQMNAHLDNEVRKELPINLCVLKKFYLANGVAQARYLLFCAVHKILLKNRNAFLGEEEAGT